MMHREALRPKAMGRGFQELTAATQAVVDRAGIAEGLCHVFLHHTSASLVFSENADPSVRADLETMLQALAPDGDRRYTHDDEGPDDMAAHLRAVLTLTEVMIPVVQGRLDLGTWQGLYLWEHRHRPHQRRLTVTVMGEGPRRVERSHR